MRRRCAGVLIGPDAFWYSGMATGMLGGMYTPEEDQINPSGLIAALGGEFLRDRVDAIDTKRNLVHLASGGARAYDYLSLNVGSQVNVDLIPGMTADSDVYSVKPVNNLWRLRQRLETEYGSGESPRLVVVGGGQRAQK
ncbi:MAG: hypothetical protein M3120_02665 [Pseudomonadota bacterium]|nr:hypothetical protein [Pseudomonadota bacterium]